jgi:hypothetical protein
VRSHAGSKKERKVMAQRFANEVIRLAVHGVFSVDTNNRLRARAK